MSDQCVRTLLDRRDAAELAAVSAPADAVEPDYLAYSECGHSPMKLWRVDAVRTIKLGDYGICWCDDDRERRVVRIEFSRFACGGGS